MKLRPCVRVQGASARSAAKHRAPVALGLLLAIATGLLGNACANKPDPPPWKEVIAENGDRSHDTPPPPKTANLLVVYLDSSGSMAGYVSPDRQGQTVYSRSLQELRNFVSLISPPIDVAVRRVDSQVSDVYPDSYLSDASINQGIYTGKETDLAGAVGLFERGVETKTQQTQPAANGREDDRAKNGRAQQGEEDDDEPPPPARFHVLVTDGVQSRTERTADASCLAGSDQICVRKRLLALLEKGWGGYVIGIRSEFRGKVFSEISRGTSVAYESKRRDPQSFRPFYIYLFSPDRAALDKLIGVLLERLRPLLSSADSLRTIALTSDYSAGATQSALDVPKESSRLLSSSKSGRHDDPPGYTLRVSVETDKKGPVPFNLKVTPPWSPNVRDGGTPGELAELVDWTLTPLKRESEAQSGKRYPELKLVGQQVEADGSVVLQATAQYPGGKTGTTEWRAYLLEGRLNLSQQTPTWIKQWSTNLDTTVESANKTLYLESALLGLWRNPHLENKTIARIYLRVGP
ncbi:MAG TPA: hypothetical protein VF656_10775 [Pyrinomonadaceae bacterium]